MRLKNLLLSFLMLGASATSVTVVGCLCPPDTTEDELTEKQIVDEINAFGYELPVKTGTSYADVMAMITTEFVKDKLTAELKEKFDDNLFKLEKITDAEGVQLDDSSFAIEGQTIEGKFVYSYGKFKEQSADISFPILSDTQQKIINDMNGFGNYNLTINVNSSYENDLKPLINADFMKTGVDDSRKNDYLPNEFQLVSVDDLNWNELTDNSLTQFGEFDLKIIYRYVIVKKQTTNLHLKIIAEEEDRIVQDINSVPNYSISTPVGGTYNDLKTQIIGKEEPYYDFIKQKLTPEDQAIFNPKAFNLQSLVWEEDGREVTDNDLEVGRKIHAKIVYDYGTTKNQTTNLIINVIAQSEFDIIQAISGHNYEMTIEVETTYNNLRTVKINADFIKEPLSDDLKAKFDPAALNIVAVNLENGQQMTDQDLKTPKVINTKIIYNYGSTEEQSTNLKLTIKAIREDDIVAAINAASYYLEVPVNTTYDQLKTKVNADFIKAKLSADLQAAFNPAFLTIGTLTWEDGHQIADSDMTRPKQIKAKINYDYGLTTGQVTNLDLRVQAQNEGDIVAAINAHKYTISVPVKSKYTDLKAKIDAAFIKAPLPPNLQASFDDSVLNIIRLNRANGQQISDSDLNVVQTIDGRINYDYGSTQNQTTVLTVTVEKRRLTDDLKDFKFKDRKNIPGFLDGDDNSMTTIQNQIVTYMGISSLAAEGLVLESRTINSVVLRATPQSVYYQGQITLTWNLKLFEIWGIGTGGNIDSDLKAGMKGYFYIDQPTNTIQWINVYAYLTNNVYNSQIQPYFDDYHKMNFNNKSDPIKNFTFNGKSWTNEIAGLFGTTFKFLANMTVFLSSPEPQLVKYYDVNTKTWKAGTNNKTFTIDSLGRVT